MDEQILCFKHCRTMIYCFDLPDVCPLCHNSISTTSLDDIPIRLPFPFVRAQYHPCSIAVKTSTGTFLEQYNSTKDLHIGVTDSSGRMFEYDSEGLHKNKTEEWKQSIIVYKTTEAWWNHWDDTLTSVCSDPLWHIDNYDETNFNCFSFVIEFLKSLNCEELNGFLDKEKFCERFIHSKIVSAMKYITVCRNIVKNGYSL